MMSCEKCVFCSTYSDMGSSSRICSLHTDLTRAINAYEDNMNNGDCPCCIFICDLYDALSRSGSLPDPNVLYTWRCVTSRSTKANSVNYDLSLSILRGSCGGE